MQRSLLPLVMLLAACLAAPARADYTAVVDPSVRYQTWQGWGTSLAWWAKVVGGFPEPARSDFMDKAFDPVKGLGLNVVRYNVGGGENPQYVAPNKSFLSFRAAVPGYEPSPGTWDWTADANQRWVLREAMKRGANQVEAFANSPPWWMTRSGSVTGNRGGADNLKPEDDAPFADYLATVAKHFQDAWGITFRDVEPLNEPSGGWGFGGGNTSQEGCHVDRLHQNDLVKATGAALTRLGVARVSVSASDECVIGDADLMSAVYDPVALSALSKINTHSYGGGDRTQLWNFANSRGKDLWLSEYGDGDASGMQMSRQILMDVRGLHPTAWVYWQVVDGGGWGLLTNPLDSESHTSYGVNKKYYVLAQYSKFIRAGATLIAVTDPNSVAAYGTQSHRLVIVTTNSGDSPARVTYDLSGFTRLGPSAAVSRTSPTEDLAEMPTAYLTGKRLVVTLPAKSVTTYLISGAVYAGPLRRDFREYVTLVNRDGRQAGGPGAQWALAGLGDGFYKVVNRESGLVLDVSASSTATGADVVQYQDNGGDNQQWRLVPAGGGFCRIVNRHSSLPLGMSGSASPPTLVQQADTGNAAQLWRVNKGAMP